jgi:hypothetical protein
LQSQSLFNPFCPICLKFVNKNEGFSICEIKNSQIYLLHDKCLGGNPSFGMNSATEEEDDMLILKNDHFKKSFPDQNITKNLSL